MKKFMVRFATVHGLASLLENNRLEYDEELNMQIMDSLSDKHKCRKLAHFNVL